MIDATTIVGPGTAFIAGMVTSLHCVGMCGPMVCAFQSPQGVEKGHLTRVSSYHTMRIISYTMIGAVAGALGAAPLIYFQQSSWIWIVPWAIVVFFVALGLGLDKKIPKPRKVSLWFHRTAFKVKQLPPTAGAGVLGFLTPLLPCGPLYLVFAVALLSGSPLAGAEFLLAFSLGTLPLLWLVHSQYGKIQKWVTPLTMNRIQRGMALFMALFISIRLLGDGSRFFIEREYDTEAPLNAAFCPLCLE